MKKELLEMQTIYRFSALILCLFLLVGCGRSKEYTAVENKLKQVDTVKSKVTTLSNFAINMDELNFNKIFKMEDDFEKSLKIEIVKADKKEIILKFRQVFILDFLGKAKNKFDDFTIDHNTQVKYLQDLINTYRQKAKEKIVIFKSVDDINPDILFLSLIGVEDLKTIVAWEKMVKTYTPNLFH